MDIVIGERDAWSSRVPFGLSVADRRRHCHIIGQTGTGKSTLLRNLLIQDIEAGRGCMLLDPHGDTAEELLDYIPPWRTQDVVYFAPADLSHPIGLNLLAQVPADERPLIASSVVAIFRHLWAESWGPRLEYILYQTIAALLDFPPSRGGISVLGVPRMFTDEAYRDRIVGAVQDARVRAFWTEEYPGWSRQFAAEAVSPIQNKVGQLLASPAVRNVLGQAHSTVSMAAVMNERKIFIANLSKGELGEDKANLLGSVLLTKVQLSAMQRATIPEAERVDFVCYADEAHSFGATETFEAIWSEARKYHLALVTTGQYLEQSPQRLQAAIFGNVGTLISFRVGNADAEVLARELDPYAPAVLSDLGRGEVCARLTRDGQPSEAFIGRTIGEGGRVYGRRTAVIEQSRRQHGRRREDIEGKILKWMNGKLGPGYGGLPAPTRLK